MSAERTGRLTGLWPSFATTVAVIRLEYPPNRVLHKSAGYLSDLRVSPDGQQVAFVEHPAKWDDRGFVNIVDRSGALKTLAGEYASVEGLAWMPDRKRLAFSASKVSFNTQPYLVAVSGSEPARQVLPTVGPVYVEDVADDGRWIVTRQDIRMSVGFRFPADRSERQISWLNSATHPFVSPTRQLVLFCDQSLSAGSDYAVFYRSANGTKPIRLGEGTTMGFSPDGKWALAVIQSTQQLVIYPIGPGDPIRLDQGPVRRRSSPRWFPDSKQILFCGSEPSKPARCYRQATTGGLPVPVTPDGFVSAWISPDGRRLLAMDTAGAGQVLSLESGALQPARGLANDDDLIAWASDNRSVLVRSGRQLPARIHKVDLLTGTRIPVREIAPPDRAGLVRISVSDMTGDGAGYAYSARRDASTLFVVHGVK